MEQSVIVEAYNPQWTVSYEREAAQIRRIAGDKLLGIEHIGSTSVIGMSAKPILDLMGGVRHLDEALEWVEPFARIGYEWVYHEAFPFRRFFRKGERGAGTHHLHIYIYKGEHWTNQQLFRDYLTEHPDVREQYASLKKRLAEDHAMDREQYTLAKGPFIESVIIRARREAGLLDSNSE
ncbi:GrpB family protein [Paenibacillus senegalensis]|uniref:GrpB family protein n=1 Tax=Paenibacillus senegalensis TaxID=1465766 RepID=UPI000289DE93|nr:GrpB family protein [Paenibacillus senegalensis]